MLTRRRGLACTATVAVILASGRAGIANSIGISVGVTGPAVDMEKVKKLLDAAISRTG